MGHVLSAYDGISRHDGVTLNGHRQDESVVVIRVFPDDVDPSGGGDDPSRFTAVMLLKFGRNVRGEGGTSRTRRNADPKGVFSAKGSSPVTISNRTSPSE